MMFFLGCAVWAYKGWVGELFPEGSKPNDFLSLYSRRFTAVEGNTTFYMSPDPGMVARWARETAPGFQFCLKVPRELTHGGLLKPAIPEALAFLSSMRLLGDRLGPMFAQLPPVYGPSFFEDLEAFLRAWPRADVPLALEVRHPDWFREPFADRLTGLMEELGVGKVLMDSRPVYRGPGNPMARSERKKPDLPLQPVVTAPFSVVRFISHPIEEVNRVYLEEWVRYVADWVRSGVKVYFFVHCPEEARSPANARLFQKLLEQAGAPVPPLPWNTLGAAPSQLRLF
jgi:uncharacterized protein YecE (DUF72 family)